MVCYEVKIPKGQPRFEPVEVTLLDQFGMESAARLAKKPRRLCAPVDLNDQGLMNLEAHLTCYDIKDAKGDDSDSDSGGDSDSDSDSEKPRFEPFEVRVSNQFGDDQILTVKKPKRLCVPSTKEFTESGFAPRDPSSLSLDHFLCYDVKVPRGLPRFEPQEVTLSDQFGDSIGLVKKPKSLCTPVDKNGEGIRNAEAHLTCYEIKQAEGEPKLRPLNVEVLVNNQFGDEQFLTVKKAKTVCVPSQKEHVE
jgi:hypothetical protein